MGARAVVMLPDGCIHRNGYLDRPQQFDLWSLVEEKFGRYRPGQYERMRIRSFRQVDP